MDKVELLKKYEKEDKILISKVLDKIEYVENRNIIEHTDFLDVYQQKTIQDILNKLKKKNYLFFGGKDNLERKILWMYPEKLNNEEIMKSFIQKEIYVFRIQLPKEMYGKYTHRNYLGGIIKLGITRDKIGDILVYEQGADIVIKQEVIEYLKLNIPGLIRFKNSICYVLSITQIKESTIKMKQIKAIVSSLRLDTIVSEVLHISRKKASDIINSERVYINFEKEIRPSKEIKQEDILSIRGKGRYKISNIEGNTKKGNTILVIEKYI